MTRSRLSSNLLKPVAAPPPLLTPPTALALFPPSPQPQEPNRPRLYHPAPNLPRPIQRSLSCYLRYITKVSFATSSPTITFTMQARRPQGAAPIAVALQPQPLQSCRSSLLSAASSPRTPCGSPRWSPIYFSSAVNGNSTDSWNSSNGPDEIEWEWKPEQVLL